MVLLVDPPMYQCDACGFAGRESAWMEHAKRAHTERLQAARDRANAARAELEMHSQLNVIERDAISNLIDAKIELALLERGGG